jgi:hypothetical protein
MRKYLPFLFPAIALLIVLFLGYRWYAAQTVSPAGQISDNGEGVKIEDLSAEEVKKINGAKDLPTVDLKGAGEVAGQVRYEVRDGRVNFTVSADLPELTEGQYQVWLKKTDSEARTKVFVLENNKAGYMGSASVAADMLPFEVIVSKEMTDDNQLEVTVLSGVIQK